MRSVAQALDELIPAASYLGSLTGDDQAAYDAIEWHDERARPSWQAVLAQRNRSATAAELVDYARQRRKAAEIGGMSWNGVSLATDETSQIKTAGARIKAMADSAFETTWYGADGDGVLVNATLIIAMSDALLEHIDGTFVVFGTVKGAIESGQITTTAEIDSAFA